MEAATPRQSEVVRSGNHSAAGRSSDGRWRRVEVHADIAASPERVFATIADARKPFLTSNPFTRMELGSAQAEGVGTIYRWTFRLPFGFSFPVGLTVRFEEVVTAWEPARQVGYEATSGWQMRARGKLVPTAFGTRAVFTLGYRLPRPWSWLMPHWLEVLGCHRALANLKRRAEAAEVPPVTVFDCLIDFAAPPEEVFQVIGDPRSKLAWVPAIRRVELRTAPPPGPDTRYLASSGLGRAEFAFEEQILDWQPPHRLAYGGASRWGRFRTTWDVAATPTGARAHGRMEYWFPGGQRGRWVGGLAVGLVRRPLQAHTTTRLKRVVELGLWSNVGVEDSAGAPEADAGATAERMARRGESRA